MKHPHLRPLIALALFTLATLGLQLSTFAQGTAFTYQGRLNDGANPASGSYDLRFTIYDSTNSPGTIIAGPLTNAATAVSNGLFTVTLDFGASVFTGAGRWLEIGVRNGGGAFATLSPRQAITSVPYAAYAMTPAGPQGPPGSPGSADAWSRTGNVGTTPGANFLGTTDNQPLEFKVNNLRGLRLEYVNGGPALGTSVNVIGGSSGNSVAGGKVGATIAGGGNSDSVNQVTEDFGTVGGGVGNTAGGHHATVSGGSFNSASGGYATVGGGDANHASGIRATVPGGYLNDATDYAFAAGRRAKANHQGAFVWADSNGGDFASTANNQFNVRASGGARFETGGAGLTVDGAPIFTGSDGSNLTGLWKLGGNAGTTAGTQFLGTTDNQPLEFKVNGQRVLRLEYGTGSGTTSANVIGGWSGNLVSSGVYGATIAGGGQSVVDINQVTAIFGTVGGGLNNRVQGPASTIGGGANNIASVDYATVGGGNFNNAIGMGATVPGGIRNAATTYAFAAGFAAKANHTGAFVWADSTGFDFASTTNDQFSVLASGGARFVTGGAGLTVDGSAVALRTGGNAFSGNQSITGGKVGIGTVSPDGLLGVRGGDIGADEGGQNSGTTSFGLRFGGSGSTEFIGSKRTTGGNQFGLDFYTANSTRVSILNNGNVGIGTASPATALHVKGAADTEISVESSSAGGHRWTLQSSHGDPAFGRAAFQIIDRTLGAGRMLIWTNGDVGIGFGFAQPASKLHVNGTVTATAFNPPSDRNLKENFTEISPRAVLDKVAALPISRWNFKGDAATPHVGPMAQDFHAAFGLGTDDKHIATVDADGVALAAIQGLNQKFEEREASLRAENTKLQQQNAELETRLAALEKLMNRLTVAKGGE